MSFVNPVPQIRERQIKMQASNTPVWLRRPGAKPQFAAFMVLFTVTMTGSVFQLVQYARGKAGKLEE